MLELPNKDFTAVIRITPTGKGNTLRWKDRSGQQGNRNNKKNPTTHNGNFRNKDDNILIKNSLNRFNSRMEMIEELANFTTFKNSNLKDREKNN